MKSGRELQTIPCLITADDLARRVKELADQISADYQGKRLLVVGVLKGAWVFMADLVRQLNIPTHCDFVMLSSYGVGTQSSGEMNLRLDLAKSAPGQDILLVEDIIDTGRSMLWLIEHLKKKNPASIRLCTLLDKPSRREVPVQIDYVGFAVPDKFVVGYGIDCAEQHRELPYVGYLPEKTP